MWNEPPKAYPKISNEQFKTNCVEKIYWVTPWIALGPFPSEERSQRLGKYEVTHLFNVSHDPIHRDDKGGVEFKGIDHFPTGDRTLFTFEEVQPILDRLHEILSEAPHKLYLHCVAGQLRSPNVLWLYFIACGLSEAEASELILRATLDARPGFLRLVDSALIDKIREHGERHYLPLTRPDILEAIE